MFKWLRASCEETKPIAADANRIVAKSSERGEPPCDVDPVEELGPTCWTRDGPICRQRRESASG